jgi:hypothetical protein
MITDREIAAVLARLDETLRDMGVPARTGACQCGRCARSIAQAPAVAVEAIELPNAPGGQLVTKPSPAPRAPRPGGIAVRLPSLEPEIVF